MFKRIIASFLMGLVFLQIVFAIFITNETYIAGPVQDVWGLMPYIEENLYKDSWLSPDLWVTQNSHRLPILKLGFLTDYFYFNGSNYFLNFLISFSFFIQVILVLCVVNPGRFFSEETIIFLCAVSILLSPTINWNYLHHFNIHIVQSALFAFLAFFLFNFGLIHKKNYLVFIGVLFGFICSVSMFSITAIWPTLVLLVLFSKTSLIKKFSVILTASFLFIAYIYMLPVGPNGGSEITHIASSLYKNIHHAYHLNIYVSLVDYVISYLSIYPTHLFFNKIITAFSLLWFCYAIIYVRDYNQNMPVMTGLSLMLFGVLMGITTAIGRGYLGDLSLGIRFQPISLVYWCGFFMAILSAYKNRKPDFSILSLLISLYLLFTHTVNSIDIQKQMIGDYVRFSKMQMAYISNNLEENAIYENMVDEWRKKSYPGILGSIPFIRENKLGIFNKPIGDFSLQNQTLPSSVPDICLAGKIYEKPRNNDKDIRNITFTASRMDYPDVSHLLVYESSILNGALFKKPLEIFKDDDGGVWMGLVKTPVDVDNLVVVAFRKNGEICAASILD